MSDQSILSAVESYIKKEMEGMCSVHDLFHIERVVKLATQIQKKEGGDLLTIQVGALLHESLDDKFFEAHEMTQRKQDIEGFLDGLGMDADQIQGVVFIIENVGYGKSLERDEDFQGSLEFQIVEDADRLEAVGAIAIARAFAYGGQKNRSIYDPAI